MVERDQHLTFPLETGHARGVLREGRRQNLEGEVAIWERDRTYSRFDAIDLNHRVNRQALNATA
jgi:hypothetical protein